MKAGIKIIVYVREVNWWVCVWVLVVYEFQIMAMNTQFPEKKEDFLDILSDSYPRN